MGGLGLMHGRARAPTPLYIPYQYCTYMLVLPDCCYKLNRSYRCSNIPFDIDAHQINIMYKCISMLSLHTKFTSISTDVTPSWGGYNTCKYHGWCTFHEIEARAIPVQLLTSTLQTNSTPVNTEVCTILHKFVPSVLHNSMRIKFYSMQHN